MTDMKPAAPWKGDVMKEDNRADYSEYTYIPLDTITAALSGDTNAISKVTERYSGYMWSVLHSLTHKRLLWVKLVPLEDIGQSVILKFISDIKNFHFLKNDEIEIITMFDSYCKKVLYHNSRDILNHYIRDTGKYILIPADDFDGITCIDSEDHLEKILVKIGDTKVYFNDEKLADAIRNLRPKLQKIIELSYILDWKDSDIAEYLKIEKKSVYQYRYQALIFLRKAMQHKR